MAINWYKLSAIEWTDHNDYSLGYTEIGGKKICLLKKGDQLDAFQNKCPHAGGNLSNGWLENGLIVCPLHRHSFNVKTGRGSEGQGNCLRIYEVKDTKEGLMIGLPGSLLNPFNWFN